MLKIKKSKFNSVLISADSDQELAESFLRFQEHYESPFWADKIFTIGQYKKWYSEKYGADTYTRDWSGFNFPSKVLVPFKEGLFDPLTKNEKIILNFFKYRNDNFYIIGSNSNDVLKHELCHALYYTNENYKKNINNLILKNKNKLNKALNYLIKIGYHKKVIFDELQAYVLDGDWFDQKQITIPENIKSDIFSIYKKCSKTI